MTANSHNIKFWCIRWVEVYVRCYYRFNYTFFPLTSYSTVCSSTKEALALMYLAFAYVNKRTPCIVSLPRFATLNCACEFTWTTNIAASMFKPALAMTQMHIQHWDVEVCLPNIPCVDPPWMRSWPTWYAPAHAQQARSYDKMCYRMSTWDAYDAVCQWVWTGSHAYAWGDGMFRCCQCVPVHLFVVVELPSKCRHVPFESCIQSESKTNKP